MGDTKILPVKEATYLGVTFTSTLSWKPHFTLKLNAAKARVAELRAVGLFGGRNIPTCSLEVVRASVWGSLDYGRGVANSDAHRHILIARSLLKFQMKTLREVLGVSDSTPITGKNWGCSTPLWNAFHPPWNGGTG